jgi:tetracycline 7-halogenase / FADH2 O2-dependent halogenase
VTSHEPRATSHVHADIAVIGSGFAGSLTALCLRKLGRSVVMVERGRHPRFAIGESSTPLANLLLEELADRYDLPNIRVFSKWGTWQRARPDVAGGLKRGFTFYFHRFGEPFGEDREHARQLLVAASPHDEIGDTHWYRPDFDSNLVREAEKAGTIYLDETELTGVEHHGDRTTLEGARHGQPVRVTASFVVDASGPRGFLVRALGLDAPPLTWLPPTQGLYTHFEDVGRWDGMVRGAAGDGAPPYPPDAAALHHVFPGGWIWMLRFNNGITSAGAALTDPVAASIGASNVHSGGPCPPAERGLAWDRLLEKLPTVRDQFCRARAVHPWIHAPRIAFRTRQVCGPTWALLPSAAGVIDPLLSTGFPLTLLGVGRLVDLLERTAAGPEREAALRRYEQITLDELDVTEQLVAALYANMADVPLFKRLTLLYFAAASFSEAARRLGRPALAPGFLLNAHPGFGAELRACAALAAIAPVAAACDALLDRIDRAIEPFDIAGLLDRSRRDWYPVLAEDVMVGASKLDATTGEVVQLLERCGFAASSARM